MDSGFYDTKVLVEIQNEGLFGAALIKKCTHLPANIKGDAIDANFDLK